MKTRVAGPGVGRAFRFHGSYTSLILARRKERAIPDAFIHEKDGRYYVLQPKRIITRSNPGKRGQWFYVVVFGPSSWQRKAFNSKLAAERFIKRNKLEGKAVIDRVSSLREYLEGGAKFGTRGNPAKSTRGKSSKRVAKVYERVLRVEAQKLGPHHCDAECRACEHKYFHDFKKGVEMFGLSPGQVFKVPAGCWPLLIMC